jgi:hypothetical protein
MTNFIVQLYAYNASALNTTILLLSTQEKVK